MSYKMQLQQQKKISVETIKCCLPLKRTTYIDMTLKCKKMVPNIKNFRSENLSKPRFCSIFDMEGLSFGFTLIFVSSKIHISQLIFQ